MTASANSPTLTRAALGGALAAAVFYLCILHHAGVLGMVGPDEPRYAAIAREMAESGDWVTPRLHGQPWFEKPILYYWAAAASFRVFGMSEAAARFPSALAALVTLLCLAILARRWYGPATAFGALLTFPTTAAAIGFGRAATTDMLFASCLTLALLAAGQLLLPPPAQEVDPAWLRHSGLLLWGAALGLAVLAKGPAGVVLAGGSVALWAVATRRWKEALRLAHPEAIFAFLLVALPWYLLCAQRNPEFVQVFIIEHNLQRFLTPVFRHEQPFWFFGPILLLGLLPWTALLFPAARDAWRGARAGDWRTSPAFFVACWVLFPLLFFSISKSKLPGYVLPVVPPLVLLLARAVTRGLEEKSEWPSRALAAVGLTFAALAMSAGYWMRRLPEESRPAMGDAGLPVWMILLGASGAAIGALALRRREWAALILSSVATAGLVGGINVRLLPHLDAHLTPRPAARRAMHEARGRPVFVHQVHRAWHYGLNFYFRRELPLWKEGETDGLIIAGDAGILDLLGRGYRVRVVERVTGRATLVTISRAPAPTQESPPPAGWPGKS